MFVKFSILSTVAAFFVNYSIFTTPENSQLSTDKKVTVAAICIGTGGDCDEKVKQAVDYLKEAGQNKVDIACLPEEFAGFNAEPIPGPTTDAIAKLARQYNMYVICPIREAIPKAFGTVERSEQAGDKQYNTAVLIDRRGEIVGSYRKVFVYWGEGLTPSKEGVKIFDTDFGKISILTCFDLNFAELWYEADALDADIVFWPSAYGGGMPLNAYAMLYHYYIVPVGWGNIIDITGENMKDVIKPRDGMFIATLDLDRTLIHTNFNTEKVAKLFEEHKGEVVQEHYYDMESWYLLKSVKPGISVRELCKKYEIETLRQYQHRSRRQINEIRETGGTI